MGQYGSLFDGKPVYPTYNDAVHCREVTPVPESAIYRGWDFGLTPACVFVQLTAEGQVVFLDEMTSERSGIDKFTDLVLQHSAVEYPDFEFIDVGDPAGGAAAQTDARSCFDIMWSKGVEIYPGDQSLEMRLESVRKGLNTMLDGMPGLVVSPRCSMLRKGFQGGYSYRRLQVAGERFDAKPEKNKFSHIHDAAQYVAAELLGSTLRGHDDEEFMDVIPGERVYGEATCGY